LQDAAAFYKHYAALNTPETPFQAQIFEPPYPTEPQNQPVRPVHMWKGSIFSVYSREAADWEGSGYGPLLMTPSVRGDLPTVNRKRIWSMYTPCHAPRPVQKPA